MTFPISAKSTPGPQIEIAESRHSLGVEGKTEKEERNRDEEGE